MRNIFKDFNFRPSLLVTIIVLIGCGLLASLGVWQLNRAQEKLKIQESFKMRNQTLLTADYFIKNDTQQDLRFYQLQLTGTFDNQHPVLLDNKIVNHQVGYELYSFFYSNNKIILVDRGFLPQGKTRDILPVIPAIPDKVTITGMLNMPPASGLILEKNNASSIKWPLLVNQIDLNFLSTVINKPLYRHILILNKNTLPTMSVSPEKHKAYAFQWFMLSATLFILYIVISIKRRSEKS